MKCGSKNMKNWNNIVNQRSIESNNIIKKIFRNFKGLMISNNNRWDIK